MKHHTPKRAAIERAYKQAKQELFDEMVEANGYVFCEGCGTTQGRITWSHRIPRSRRRDLIAAKEHIDLMCHACHEHVEAGRYEELKNGKEIESYIQKMEPELLIIKSLRKDAA